MALTRLTTDLNVIAALDNYPPDDPGMTPALLKAKFDQAPNAIKTHINDTLIPELEAGTIASIARTSGDGSAGTSDTYTITYQDGSTDTFTIYNGADGATGPQGIQGIQGIQGVAGADGADGADGAAATITVGTVTTGAAGSSATVTNSGTENAALFDFVIPQGAKGDDGVSPTVAVKTSTDSAYVLTVTDANGSYDTPNLKEAKFVTDQNTGSQIKVWYGTVAEFNALSVVDNETEYNILEEH